MTAFAGKWTYRSFRNDPAMVTGDADTALGLFFAEATFRLADAPGSKITGGIDWQGGGLDLVGTVTAATETCPLMLHMAGMGRAGTPTADWEYDYHGWLAYQWPNGKDQVAAIVGSVVRAKPHGGAPAGYVASFVAVRQP
jgi:hypothetical protein